MIEVQPPVDQTIVYPQLTSATTEKKYASNLISMITSEFSMEKKVKF
jgi:hypothetical protein